MMNRLLPLCIAATAGLAAGPAWAGSAGDSPIATPTDIYHQAASATPLPAGQLPVAQMPLPNLPPQPGQYASIPATPAAPAYPPEYQRARADWVEECVSRYLDDRRGKNGGVLGGILGAVVGGVAGNRIANRGSRLGGTLLGAGAGGLVGAVVGSAIDRSNRGKAENEALDWCEDYLARNTATQPPYGYGYPPGFPAGTMAYPVQAYPMAYAYGPPMMMQPVMIPVQRCHEHEVAERTVYRTIRVHKTVRDKRLRMQPAKSVKYVKSIK